MTSNNNYRDTILVVGPSASGKTETLNILRFLLDQERIPLIQRPVSDSHTIYNRVREDDEVNRGTNHYHDWCPGNINGHSHSRGEPHLPFTLAGNYIVERMMKDFFNNLKNVEFTGAVQFAEWSGGVNTNPYEEPASLTDLSFGYVCRLMQSGEIDASGLHRVIAILHMEANNLLRLKLNKERKIPTKKEFDSGTASWPLSETAMHIFGEDDFKTVEPFLREIGEIPYFFHVSNTGDHDILSRRLEKVLREAASSWYVEARKSGSPES